MRLGPLGLRQLYRRCRFVLNLGREVAIANQPPPDRQLNAGAPHLRSRAAGGRAAPPGPEPAHRRYYGPGRA